MIDITSQLLNKYIIFLCLNIAKNVILLNNNKLYKCTINIYTKFLFDFYFIT